MAETETKPWHRVAKPLILALLLAAVGVGIYLRGKQFSRRSSWGRAVEVMGTRGRLMVTGGDLDDDQAQAALDAAVAALRSVEARMSARLERSDVGRLNAAPAGQEVELTTETRDVLAAARDMHERTDGAFDVTVGPLLALWKQAGERQRRPDDAAVEKARAASRWQDLRLTDAGAIKDAAEVAVDLGGIAKGYALDAAVEALQRAGCDAGLVELGGDIRCFEGRAGADPWIVDVRDPFDPDRRMDYLAVPKGAVCTSGNYARYVEIDEQRYSHIVDPRTGRPADRVPSVTVVAPSATVADAWATALSVLGPAGLDRLPDGVEAMLVIGTPTHYEVHATEGYRRLRAAFREAAASE